jgi:hypothetical protein
MIPGSPKRKRSGRGNYFIAISQYHQDFDKWAFICFCVRNLHWGRQYS